MPNGKKGGKPPLIAEMYGRQTLDCVIEAAHAVSLDFVNRPRNYRQTPAEIGKVLASFKARTGFDPEWPDTAQRAAIYGALFGAPDAKPQEPKSSQFHQLAGAVRQAAVAYSERVFDTGEPMLRRAFIDAAIALQAYLTTLVNGTLQTGGQQTEKIFNSAVEVLNDDKVAGVFGVPPAPKAPWPLYGDYSGDGGFLLEEITRTLAPPATGQITQQKFVVLQRIALHGMLTIARTLGAVEHYSDAEIKELIGDAYSWATALRDLGA